MDELQRTTDDVVSVSDTSLSAGPDAACPSASQALVIKVDADFIAPFTLSLALSACLIIFSVQACNHPAAILQLAPALNILAPVVAVIVNFIRCKRCRSGGNNGDGH